MRKLVFSIIFLFISAPLYSIQETAGKSKIGIYVNHTGDDIIGSRLAYELREIISASARYEIASENEVIILEISLVSADANILDRKGIQSVISYVYIFYPGVISVYGRHGVMLVGGGQASAMASSIASTMDKVIVEKHNNAFRIFQLFHKGINIK